MDVNIHKNLSNFILLICAMYYTYLYFYKGLKNQTKSNMTIFLNMFTHYEN